MAKQPEKNWITDVEERAREILKDLERLLSPERQPVPIPIPVSNNPQHTPKRRRR